MLDLPRRTTKLQSMIRFCLFPRSGPPGTHEIHSSDPLESCQAHDLESVVSQLYYLPPICEDFFFFLIFQEGPSAD